MLDVRKIQRQEGKDKIKKNLTKPGPIHGLIDIYLIENIRVEMVVRERVL